VKEYQNEMKAQVMKFLGNLLGKDEQSKEEKNLVELASTEYEFSGKILNLNILDICYHFLNHVTQENFIPAPYWHYDSNPNFPRNFLEQTFEIWKLASDISPLFHPSNPKIPRILLVLTEMFLDDPLGRKYIEKNGSLLKNLHRDLLIGIPQEFSTEFSVRYSYLRAK
jgi:hypothetical protein